MAREEKMQPVVLENRRIHFRNFSGAPGKYNNEGDRNFVVFLEEAEALAMEKDGWNIKWLQPREVEDQPAPIVKVRVKWPREGGKGRPPRVILITSRGKTQLDESQVSLLDWADVENVDMIVRPWRWEINGNTGVSAYLNSIYVTIREDELERKYSDVPDSAASSIIEGMESDPPWEE